MPRILVGGKLKRTRVSRLGKRVTDLPIDLPTQNRLRHSEIKSFHGESGASINTGLCSTVVAQLKARRKEPVTVIWHVLPSHVSDLSLSLRGVPWRKIRGQRELHEGLLKDLRSGTKHEPFETRRIHPKAIVNAIVTYLDEERNRLGKGKVSVTLLPGLAAALDSSASAQALEELQRMFGDYQRNRRVDNIRTRGMSKSATTVGSCHVLVTSDGRIHRLRVLDKSWL